MSRYIDVERIDREYKRIKIANGYAVDDWLNGEEISRMLEQAIDETPTADVVEVVRCKDCRHYLTPDGGSSYCAITHIRKGPEDYCSDGKENTK